MQIGIDLGATKIESVLLDDNGSELHRSRKDSPKDYNETLVSITESVKLIENKFKKNLNVGVCHPGSTNLDTGLIQNAFNSPWLNNMKFSDDISKSLDRKVLCENDANCFALSEAFDGAAKHYKIVRGIILGSGCGGGLKRNKKILVGPKFICWRVGTCPMKLQRS
jgi:Transcriptional regulator/sugar kinase